LAYLDVRNGDLGDGYHNALHTYIYSYAMLTRCKSGSPGHGYRLTLSTVV